MGKNKQNVVKRKSRAESTAEVSVDDDILLWLLKATVAALLVGRLLVPPEATVDGETVWIVQLWLVVGLLWSWWCYRERDFRPRFDRLDLALGVLIAGHVISALAVVMGEGQKRTALNMLWEWVGLGVAFFLTRQVLRTRGDGRQLLLVMVSTVGSLAALGLWQHYEFYPRMDHEYQQLRGELDRHEEQAVPTSRAEAIRRQQRITELRRELSEQNIPLEGSSRALWESRLHASSEPFGLFALANSFAGLLVVWLLVALGFLASNWWGKAGYKQLILWSAVVGLMLFCLVLTKSRTAWVGLFAGLVTWGGLSLRRGLLWTGLNWRVWSIVGVLLVFAVLFVAGLSGGFDLRVISEAPKSLQYRWQYWTGSWQVLSERPLLGTGPGNFRQHYLKHKLPASSEEIADPHNLLLDVWSSGGLIALGGLLALIGVGATCFRRQASLVWADENRVTKQNSTDQASLLGDALTIGMVGGFGMIWLFGWVMGELDSSDYRFLALPLMLVGSLVLLALLRRNLETNSIPLLSLAAAAMALLVHLLGAGGIEMPAISQILFVLLAVAAVNSAPEGGETERASPIGLGVVCVGLLVLLVTCFLTATVPVMQSRTMMNNGNYYHLRGDLDRAEKFYLAASRHDPLSPQPLERMARVYWDRWVAHARRDQKSFEKAVELQKLAIELNPYSALGHERLGDWYRLRFERSQEEQDARAAAGYFQRAVERYPSSASLRADYAEALASSGEKEKARHQAEAALEQDEINHREGHRDKFLPTERLERLRSL